MLRFSRKLSVFVYISLLLLGSLQNVMIAAIDVTISRPEPIPGPKPTLMGASVLIHGA